MIAGRPVLLGVSGGIASYKACFLVRQLRESGAVVDVVMTASATEFIRPLTFEALSGRPVIASLWQPGRALDHIHLGRDAELIVLAPATANLLAKAALGLADDILTTILVAARVPILAAPAMNDHMYAHPATAANIDTLQQRGWTILGPAVGDLAEGPSDMPGRMVEPDEIAAYAVRILRSPGSAFAGKRVVVTAGATREHIDPVRVITNPSSGRMGFAVAEAAFARGADVTLVSGPTPLPRPVGVATVAVESTKQMLETVEQLLSQADVLIMAAAPSDYSVREVAEQKIAREDGSLSLALDPTPDVLTTTIPKRPKGAIVVGFALEAQNGAERARAKLERKRLDMIVLNSVNDAGAGFEALTNRVTFISKDSAKQLPLLPKRDVAERLLDEVEGMLRG